MRFAFKSLLLGLIGLAGCGGGPVPSTVSTSELDSYIRNNPQAVAAQQQAEADLYAEKDADE